jgi:hypothetical protein
MLHSDNDVTQVHSDLYMMASVKHSFYEKALNGPEKR